MSREARFLSVLIPHGVSILSRLVFAFTLLGPAATAQDRIVTLGASVTEIVFALGAGDRIVARDSSSLYPAAATKLPDVGYFRTIGAEGIFSMEPDLILAAQGAGPDSQVEILKRSGIPFVHLDDQPSASSVLQNIRLIGRRLGKSSSAQDLVAQLEDQFAEAGRIAASSAQTPSAIFLMGLSGNATRAAYDQTAATGIIQLAGGRNPLTGYQGYKATSPEEIYAINPDVILVSSRGHGAAEPVDFEDPPAWLAATRAWQNGRVYRIDMAYYLVFGPRVGQAAVDLARLLHQPSPPAEP